MKQNIATQAFIQEITARVLNKNSNFLGVVIGLPGTGKSYACLRLGELFTESINARLRKKGEPELTFDINNVAFSPVEFMKKIHGKDALPPCSTIIFEEAGTSLDSKNALSKINKMMSHVAETMRYRRYVTLFNLPRFGNLDKTIRSLCHGLIETKKINHKERVSYVKPLFFQYNPKTDVQYHKFLKFTYEGKRYSATSIKLKKPSVILAHRYETMKNEFANDLYADIMKEMGVEENPDPTRTMCTNELKVWHSMQDNPDKGLKDIQMETDINRSAISRILKKFRMAGLLNDIVLKQREAKVQNG